MTNGHLDIVRRAARLFDHVIVAVATNPLKKTFFSVPERLELLRTALKPLLRAKRVSVENFDGLLVHYARRRGATALVRGLRAVADFEYEFQMALMNRQQAPQVETVFLMPDEKYTYLSSTLLKEVVKLGGTIDNFVPSALAKRIQNKLRPSR